MIPGTPEDLTVRTSAAGWADEGLRPSIFRLDLGLCGDAADSKRMLNQRNKLREILYQAHQNSELDIAGDEP